MTRWGDGMGHEEEMGGRNEGGKLECKEMRWKGRRIKDDRVSAL